MYFTHTSRRNLSRGQAATELLVGMLAIVPIYMLVMHIGSYMDAQQTVQQATRYATFQRAANLDETKLTNDKLAEQTRLRYFVDQSANGGAIRSDDALGDRGTEVKALWHDIENKPLLADASSVSITFAQTDAGGFDSTMNEVVSLAGKAWPKATSVQIEVPFADRLRSSDPQPIRLAAGLAASVDPLASSGNDETRSLAKKLGITAVLGSNLDSIQSVLDVVFPLLESTAPQLDCAKPDAVPNDRVDGGVGDAGAC